MRAFDRRFAMGCWLVTVWLAALGAPARALDLLRAETGVDRAVAAHGVSGRGVVMAILGRGLDWKCNDFRNPDGTTRLDSVLDLTDDTGATQAGNPYGMGTLYTRAQIDTALRTGAKLAYRDALGRGTATAGIAVGNGANSGGKYRGIAPNATIVAIKLVGDATPAHDDQPAEAGFYLPTRVPVAIDYARDRARQLVAPCVILLNVGGGLGPNDGTSALARKIDATVGPGIPGLVFVSPSGDFGGVANHAGGVVTAGGSVTLRVQKGTAPPLTFDLWYSENDRFAVSVKTTQRSNLIQDGGGVYGLSEPASGAIVGGIIALMLEINPKLDAPTVKRILQQTARADTFTGTVPNASWGYGKVDAAAALALTKQEMGL